ncbi:MAG: L,D-transpeptidase family protein [Alteraurantiacibacter sp.]
MRNFAFFATIATAVLLPAAAMAQTVDAEDVLDSDDAAEVTATPGENTAVVQADPRIATMQPWSIANASALLSVIEGIGAEGLNPADYRPDLLRADIAAGPGEALDRRASGVFAWLVEDLRDGRTPMESRRQWFVVDPDADLLPTGTLMTQALETGEVARVLADLNPTHPDYLALREELANTPDSQRSKKRMIRANMDRWRWLARDLGGQYLITNVPEYQLRLTVNNNIISTYRTIVGAPGRTATPQLAETVEGVVFNPTWTVPQSIVRGEGLGNRVLNNPSWARANGYTAERGANGWVTVVQQPGPGNSLGRMKLHMPNEHAIFLHDTPARNLFGSDNRARSHGCIRVERALELAMTVAILGRGASRDEAVEISTSGEYNLVPVEREMPVYITYFTMGVDIDGNLRTFEDIYGRDAPVLAALDAPRVDNRARESDEEVIEIVEDARTVVG